MARQMKDSGVEWFGGIPRNWEVVPHKYIMHKEKEICTKYNNEDIISLTMNGVIVRDLVNPIGKMPATFVGYQKVYAGNLLMCLFDIDVTPRCIGYIRNNGLTSPAYSQFVVDNGNYAQYYNYLLRMIDDGKYFLHLSKNLRSSLTEENFGVIKTVKPPIEEQKRITDFLDEKVGEIDSVIAKTKETIEDYKRYKQTFITDVVTKGLNPDVEVKGSKLQWVSLIPKHWKERKILHIISMPVIDGPHVSPELVDSGIPYISADAIENGKIDFNRKRGFITKEYSEECNKRYKPQKNDILVVKLGASTGKMAIVGDDTNFNIWVPLAVVRCKENIFPKYVFYSMESSYFKNEIRNGWTFGTQETLGVKTLEQLKVFVPPLEEQKKIATYLDEKCTEIDNLIAKKEELITDLESYKKALIYEYVTGKKEI